MTKKPMRLHFDKMIIFIECALKCRICVICIEEIIEMREYIVYSCAKAEGKNFERGGIESRL